MGRGEAPCPRPPGAPRPSSSTATPESSSGRATPTSRRATRSSRSTPPAFYALETHLPLPVDVLSSHKEKDDAWTAFYDAIRVPRENLVLLRDTTPTQTVIASSDDDTYNAAVA